LIETVWGLGALIGGGMLTIWKPKIKKVYLVSFAHLLIGIAFFTSALLTSEYFILYAVLTSLGGISAAFYNAGFTATVQEMIHPDMLGRVFSLYYSLDVLPTILALIGTGFLVGLIGINTVFIVLGSIVCIIGIISYLTPAFKKMN